MSDFETKIRSAVIHYEKELNTLRTSRANPSMLDSIFVDAYGAKTPLNQLGNISIQDASTIAIQIWDASLIKSTQRVCQSRYVSFSPPIAYELLSRTLFSSDTIFSGRIEFGQI